MVAVLIVDDDIPIAMELEELTESLGYRVVGSAYSGAEAVRIARRKRPDLVLMDIIMPGEIDGITAAQTLESELGIPSIFVSCHTREDVLSRATEAFPLGFIYKPFTQEQVKATLWMACEGILLQRAFMDRPLRSDDKSAEREEAREDPEQPDTGMSAHLLKPVLTKLKQIAAEGRERILVETVDECLKGLPRTPSEQLPPELRNLTFSEMRIAELIRQGWSSKEIGRKLKLSPATIIWHRKNIRKKLGMSKSDRNLRAYILNLEKSDSR